eukprot:NODE_5682_length_494_cov_74.492135_g4248_i0.p3 GENE.NODE_5682_length_494_cov_74.492135_g4248_i0~~NODE_5682_length_494_cov_74.492135_g4248_i0.p3  ORF type:complete len:65 (+),score=5.42 NODE_5682_length_494_cov_74.492135_g4248_i0:226-420(+)
MSSVCDPLLCGLQLAENFFCSRCFVRVHHNIHPLLLSQRPCSASQPPNKKKTTIGWDCARDGML